MEPVDAGRLSDASCRMTPLARLLPRIAGGLAAALWLGFAGCGGSSTGMDTAEILPDGPDDPRAYTEQFLSQHPGAVLRPGLMAVLTLEPTRSSEDTGRRDGVDEVSYQFDAPTELELTLAPTADRVGALVLRKARGGLVAQVTNGTTHVSLPAGRHRLEVHHRDAGNPAAPTQMVFVRAALGAGATLQASSNCPNCNFDNASLSNQTFDGLDLSHSTFSEADVEFSSFVSANLSGTRWASATLKNVDFSDAVMQQAGWFSNPNVGLTSIFACDFQGADLTGARFDYSWVNTTTFGSADPSRAANLSNTSWRTLLDPCFFTLVEDADFRNVDLSGALFLGTQISDSDFSGASLVGASLIGAYPPGFPMVCEQANNLPEVTVFDAECVFGTEPNSGRKTDFSNAIFASSAGPAVQLQGQKLSGVVLKGAQFEGGAFDNFDLSGSDLTGANLMGTQLNGANLQSATLAGAMLSKVQLNRANLDGLDLRGQTMVGAQLNGASLYETNLQGINLDNAELVGARLNLSNLKDASLRGVVAGVQPGSSAQVTQLGGAYMINVDLTDADLRSADLSGAHLYGTSLLVRTLLDSADLSGALCAGTTFSGSLNDTVFNQAVLVNATFNGADLTDAKFDTAYLQGTNFATASSVFSATLRNAQVSTESGSWVFTEQDGTPYTFEYDATQLGAFTSDGSVICPNNASGPCLAGTLVPVDNGPFPPKPTCVPSFDYCYENCLDPPVYSQRPPSCN